MPPRILERRAPTYRQPEHTWAFNFPGRDEGLKVLDASRGMVVGRPRRLAVAALV
jgi:hypothetical protein